MVDPCSSAHASTRDVPFKGISHLRNVGLGIEIRKVVFIYVSKLVRREYVDTKKLNRAGDIQEP